MADLVGDIQFADNQDVLNIIGGKGGVLRMLDEEIKFGARGSSESFFKKMCKTHAKPESKRGKGGTGGALITTKAHATWFKVRHFAGVVQYESEGFLEKNKDTLNGEIVTLLQASSDPLVQTLFAPPPADAADDAGESKSSGVRRRKKKAAKTVSSQFRASLTSLMTSIKATDTHYIRCIKSNQRKVAGEFDSKYVLDQLNTGGVFSTVDIRAKGFPFRKSHKDFVKHFRVLAYTGGGVAGVPAIAPQGADAPEDNSKWCATLVASIAATHCLAISAVLALRRISLSFEQTLNTLPCPSLSSFK